MAPTPPCTRTRPASGRRFAFSIRPGAAPRVVFDSPDGFIFDMSPSYDARKLVFTLKQEVGKRQDSFHIYEIGIDGIGLRQLTTGRYHDFSPVYLPDGRIVFNSTRVESYSLCQDFLAASLHVMDANGENLRRLEYNTLCDTTPYILQNGEILFSRWEYQDKNIFCTQALWTIHPDGSQVQLFYGNTLTIPNSIYGAKQIPGTPKLVCVMAAHHFPPLGAIGIIDRSLGMENPKAMTNITPEIPYVPTVGKTWRDTNWHEGDKFYPWSYTDPWPIDEHRFLVSYGGPMEDGPRRYRLYLLDDKGSKTLLYDDLKASCFNAIGIEPRALPPQFPGSVPDEPKGEGRFFVQDVYQGLLGKGIERGQVKALRIMSQIPKKYNTEGPRYSDHYPAIGEGSYYVKYNYGTVPVAADGSAYFVAPAGVELYFQALDADGKEVRRMGTTTQITQGEVQGCVGCHEPRTSAPPSGSRILDRLRKRPDRITPPPWGAGTVDFVRQVQPVLDRYCAACHSGPEPKGRADVSGDKTRLFNMAFETLVFGNLVARYHINGGPTGNYPPLATGSYVSRITELIERRHADVNMDDESRRRIYTWIDANVPYYGTWEMTRPHTLGGRDTWLDTGNKPLPWFEKLLEACKMTSIEAMDVRARKPRLLIGNADINLTHPEWSRILRRHLARGAGGQADDLHAVFRDTYDPRYQAMLAAIREGKKALLAKPRMDMPGAVAVPQDRDFGRTF